MATTAPTLDELIMAWALEQGYEARQVLEGAYVIIETNGMQFLVSGDGVYCVPLGDSWFPLRHVGNLPRISNPEFFSILKRIIES